MCKISQKKMRENREKESHGQPRASLGQLRQNVSSVETYIGERGVQPGWKKLGPSPGQLRRNVSPYPPTEQCLRVYFKRSIYYIPSK